MIDYHSKTDFALTDTDKYTEWIITIIREYEREPGQIQYVFLDDEELLAMNQEYLKHDYYTDIITFDYSAGDDVTGDIFISVDRVKDNARDYRVDFKDELRRVMIHGILHLLGMQDSTDAERNKMRKAEDAAMKLFHVKH
ncbi:rRNA maturation RNase YbeY [Robiginitalea sp. M366]|uniref:rRNA maturation RNase YbeY n=1 Tax=Robiginitalea aestuariiviva TaxID=3036903 RepID=UPI00240E996B|nr:rRNA maturation RNase YbeY [Robiginitalea aestuariiviva]MDG1571501.1 rRNA maturation RNase YbeY [Robiginitalea aestuariiviva]